MAIEFSSQCRTMLVDIQGSQRAGALLPAQAAHLLYIKPIYCSLFANIFSQYPLLVPCTVAPAIVSQAGGSDRHIYRLLRGGFFMTQVMFARGNCLRIFGKLSTTTSYSSKICIMTKLVGVYSSPLCNNMAEKPE